MSSLKQLGAQIFVRFRDPSASLLLANIVSNAFRFGSNLVLARLLAPEAFGLVAIASFVAVGLSMISDLGVWLSLVRRHGQVDRDWLAQLWTLQAIRGVILWGFAAALGPLLAKVYVEPALAWILPATGFTLAVQNLQCLAPHIKARDLRPGLSLKLQLVGQLVGALTSITVALLHPSVWALVAGLLAASVSSTVLSFIWSREYPPQFRLTKSFVAQQLGLARWLGLSSGLSFFAGQLDRLIFPAMFGTAAFGVYAIALTLALIPQQLGQRWSDRIYMPMIAKLIQKDPDDQQGYRSRLHRTVVVYGALAAAMLVGVGPPFFLSLYPHEFAAAAAFIQVLALAMYATFLTHLHRRVFLYHGFTRLEVAIELSRLLLFGLPIGAAFLSDYELGAVQYVLLYALAQVSVYAGLLVIGRFKHLVHMRDDVPAHVIFVTTGLLLIIISQKVTERFGPLAALVVAGTLGGVICLTAAARLGLPKVPSDLRAPARKTLQI